MSDTAGQIPISDRNFENHWRCGSALYRLTGLAIIAAAVVYAFRSLYYLIFPWILSKNLIYPSGTLTPWIEGWNAERDGIEIYVLYLWMFLIIGAVMALAALFRFIPNKWVGGVLLAWALLFSYKLVAGVVFTPPSGAGGGGALVLLYCGLFGLLLLALFYYQRKISSRIEALLACCILLPFCFIATGPIAISNYVYIFSPAQKLLEGVSLSEIYFQYDLLLSVIAGLWMKLGFNLTRFQILGQLSYFVAILGIFLMARNLFRQKILSLFLLIALILVRIASAPWDPVYVFQITPLRLELWLVPFAIIYFRGPYHWLLPLSCGVLMLVHGNFGRIYTLGYLQLMVTLSALSVADVGVKAKWIKWKSFPGILRLAAIAGFLLACFLISRAIFAANIEATSYYQKIGIGFIPMAKSSFFWIFPIIVAITFVLLWELRNKVTPRYVALGFVLIYFALGNCIYFFGRSHELNLFSISIPLIFVVFYALDLVERWLTIGSETRVPAATGNVALILGGIFILATAYTCSNQIGANISAKFSNALALRLHSGDPFAEAQVETDEVLREIRGVVGPSSAIQFMVADEGKEFLFYQSVHGNTSYFYPFASWIFLNDLIQHAQSGLDDGAYLLIDKNLMQTVFDARLKNIGFRYTSKNDKYALIAVKPPSGSREAP